MDSLVAETNRIALATLPGGSQQPFVQIKFLCRYHSNSETPFVEIMQNKNLIFIKMSANDGDKKHKKNLSNKPA
jgi:hypothetical protein